MSKSLSAYLDVVRLFAAFLVYISHANYPYLSGKIPGLWRLSNMGNEAVMLFFVLSGFVIAYVVEHKETTPRAYVLSRAARLYSVIVPALILAALCDAIGRSADPSLYLNRVPDANVPWVIVSAMLFLNELWFSSTPAFSNNPFWSIGYEAWYYLIFGLWVFARGASRVLWITLACLIAGPKILLLFPVWLMGVAAYRFKVPRSAAVPVVFGSVVGLALCLVTGTHYLFEDASKAYLGVAAFDALSWSRFFANSYLIGALIACHFAGVATLLKGRDWTSAKITYAASFTFALYLFHLPLLFMLSALATRFDISNRIAFVAIGPLPIIWALGLVTEGQKGRLKQWMAGFWPTALKPA